MSYTVTCPSCTTSFPVDPQKVPEEGVLAQCSICPEVFEVMRPDESEVEPAPDVEVALPVVEEPAMEIEVPEPLVTEEPGDFVLETSDGFGGIDTPAATVEEPLEELTDTFGGPVISFDEPIVAPEPVAEEAPVAEPEVEADFEPVAEEAPIAEPEVEADFEPVAEPEVELAPEPISDPVVEEAPTPPAVAPIQFGRRDPSDKAKSLARSLVSDIIAYHKDKHTQSVASGTLVQDFEEEIEKSWKEYTEQVEPDVVAGNSFFNDALNEILARGEDVFTLDG